MDFKNKLDEVYKDVVHRLENFKSSHAQGTLNRMIDYMKEIGEALKEFAEKVAHKGSELMEKYPDKKEEIKKYISELKDKLISTYKHK
jgi:hypothetical protein